MKYFKMYLFDSMCIHSSSFNFQIITVGTSPQRLTWVVRICQSCFLSDPACCVASPYSFCRPCLAQWVHMQGASSPAAPGLLLAHPGFVCASSLEVLQAQVRILVFLSLCYPPPTSSSPCSLFLPLNRFCPFFFIFFLFPFCYLI